MAAKIGVLEADQLLGERPVRHVKRSVADLLVRRLLAWRVNKFLIQMVQHAMSGAATAVEAIASCRFTDGPFGIGNLLPFTKIQNPLMAPERLHYEIPACGARTRLLRVRNVNHIPTPEEAAG